jgi:hypothetical protein
MNLKSVKFNQSNSKDNRQLKFSEEKENSNIFTNKKNKIDFEENGTTKVRKSRVLIDKYIQNPKTPENLKDQSKKSSEETEKIPNRNSTEQKQISRENDEENFSTTFSDIENSLSNKSDKDYLNKLKLIPEKRLEDFFIKKPKADASENDYYAIDQWYIYEEFMHPLIPSISKNTEIYKNKLIQKNFKKPIFQNYKTDSCKTMEFLLSGKGKRNFKEFESFNSESDYSNNISSQVNFMKKRKVSSCKKVYESVLIFHDSSSNPHYFKVYQDNETGFDNRYNQILKTMEMDNDVETDEEQLHLARNYTLDNIRDTIKNFNSKQLRNKIKFKRSRTTNPGRRRRL